MLKRFYNLEVFFKDNYRRISVREYARIAKISAPTASKLLQGYFKENLLKKEEDRNYIYYYANRESSLFIGFSRIYWQNELEKSGFIEYLENNLITPVIILYGSLSKAETKADSDIDIAVFTVSRRNLDLTKYEKKLKRDIQLFIYKSRNDVKNKKMLNNILNGHKIRGSWQ